MARLLATSDRPLSTVANCCQNGALYGCPKNLEGFLRDIGKISKWQQTLDFSGFSSVFFKERATIPSAPPKFQQQNRSAKRRSIRVPHVYLCSAFLRFFSLWSFRRINNLRVFNDPSSSIPTAPPTSLS